MHVTTHIDLDSELVDADRPVLVDFWAPWCAYCRALAPVIDEMAADHDLHLVKINVDESPEIAQRFQLRGIPQLLLFRGRDLIGSYLGTGPRDHIERQLGLRSGPGAEAAMRRRTSSGVPQRPPLSPMTPASEPVSRGTVPGDATAHRLT